uniref:Ig-like domain-containing protein n=1 Tax=Strix occidentalis caurina TaxID=311401 RepID=A0A8D0EHM1_STROC
MAIASFLMSVLFLCSLQRGDCPYVSNVSLLMVTWKKKCSTCCSLAYRRDHNETRKLKCSERMMWKYSPDSDPALRIYPVNLGDEGNYTCEVVSSAGNFLFFSSLTVIVHPTVTLTYDKSRVAVCQASAGKPAAEISWIPASNHSTAEEVHHPNGTVTRVSYLGWVNSTLPNVTCLNSILQGWQVSSVVAALISFEERETVQTDELKMKVCLYTQMPGCVRQLSTAGWHPDISSVSQLI